VDNIEIPLFRRCVKLNVMGLLEFGSWGIPQQWARKGTRNGMGHELQYIASSENVTAVWNVASVLLKRSRSISSRIS
jgi:hypothetical protein